MAKNPRTGQESETKVEVFEKKDLYYDIKSGNQKKIGIKEYLKKLMKLEIELVKLQEWVKANKLRVVVIFEGRDAAGKGGVIKTIAGCLNPRICRIVALGVPTEKKNHNGIFSVMFPSYHQEARSYCSTGAGTTGQASKR